MIDHETADEMFEDADRFFRENDYPAAEPILNQLVLNAYKRPEVFHMLGTIYYDQGKFKKAIRAFERALEIDPSFTDSSVGLSIILNDLGRYDEGKRVFDEAKLMLAQKSKTGDAQMDERFATKHEELGDLYYRYERFAEAIREFNNALALTTRKSEIKLHIADCHFETGDTNQAIRELKGILKDNKHYIPALLRLGKAFYDMKQIPEAVEQWERVITIEPNNSTARDYLRLVQTVRVTSMNEPMYEI